MPSYHITEPHPSVPKSHYIYSGRGGAGNIAHYNAKDITSGPTASGPASKTQLFGSASHSGYYTAGRGGAGNIYRDPSERAIFSFDEELERQRKMMEHQAPVYHVGRGGAGNAVDEMAEARRSSHSSASSQGSARRSFEGAFSKLRQSLSRN